MDMKKMLEVPVLEYCGNEFPAKVIYNPMVAERKIAECCERVKIEKKRARRSNWIAVFAIAVFLLAIWMLGLLTKNGLIPGIIFGLGCFFIFVTVINGGVKINGRNYVIFKVYTNVPEDFHTANERFCEIWQEKFTRVLRSELSTWRDGCLKLVAVDDSNIVHEVEFSLEGVDEYFVLDLDCIKIDLVNNKMYLPYNTR